MTKQEIMQAVEEKIVGNQYNVFGYTDIDNAMMALGATSIFDGISISDFIADELPCWSFIDDDSEVVTVGLRWKIIDGEIEKAVVDFQNGDIEEWQLEEVAQKATIEILSAEEI